MSTKDSPLEVRVAVLEEKADESSRVHDRIFRELDDSRNDFKEMTNKVEALTNKIAQYSTYNKFLWPAVVVATNLLIAIIGFLTGGGHL